MYATGVIIILVAVLYVLFWIAVSAGIVYLFILIVKALKKYVNSKEVREEKKAVAKSLGEALKENHPLPDDAGICGGNAGRQPPVRFQMGERLQRP